MTRWLVYKHKFNYKHMCDPPKDCLHNNCTLEFIVSIDEKIAGTDLVKNAATLAMEDVCNVAEEGSQDKLITYDFGSMSTNDMLDDVKKLFLTHLPSGEKKVHLWLDKDDEFSLWDDGSDVNSLCK